MRTRDGVVNSYINADQGVLAWTSPPGTRRPQDIGGWPPSTGSVSAWGETDGCATATTNPHPPATCVHATSHRDAWRLPAPHRPSGLRLLGEKLANAGVTVRCSSSTRAIPEDP